MLEMNMELLRTKRLILRRFEDDDFKSLSSLMTDAETMLYTGFKKPQPVEKIRELLTKWQSEGTSSLGVWAVVQIDSNDFIGWSMLKVTNSDFPELGYMLSKQKWGMGYATELAAAILDHAFSILKFTKVLAVTSANNFASIRVLEKIGMLRSDENEPGSESIRYECESDHISKLDPFEQLT